MLFADIARMVAALAVVLGLIGLLVVGLRRFGPETLRRLQVPREDRRLSVIETLVLDPSRRLVLVKIDNEEQLILLGEGLLLTTQAASRAPPRRTSGERPR
jgi:flagellar protein FliO/FliZ